MKTNEVKFDDSGFEEVDAKPANPETGGSGQGDASGGTTGGIGGQANRPDLRVVQADRDKSGNVVYTNVGGMWKNVSKNGNEFYTLKIGQMKLLVFPNDRK